MCENGGTLDPSTCICACLPEYTGVSCESESFAHILIIRLCTYILYCYISIIIVMFILVFIIVMFILVFITLW